MSVFVILSLAVAVAVCAVLVLAGLQLVRAVRRLVAAATTVRDRLAPLGAELQAELAVTTTETAALQETVDGWQRQRDARRQAKQTLREGVRRSVRH